MRKYIYNSTELDEDVDILDETSLDEDNDNEKKLVLYNDDVNTFDNVIQAIMEICGHQLHQAEQLTMMIHYKGKATVKEGSFDKLVAMQGAFILRKINAEIQ